MKNLLFVCSRNRLRSPTAEQVFSSYDGIEVCSAGLDRDADHPVTPELLRWADLIFVMERRHRRKLQTAFRASLNGKRIICLEIPDDYGFMEPALVRLLEAKVPRFLPVAVRASRGPVISRAVLEDAAGVARIHVDAWQAAYAGILSNEYLAAQSLARREAYWQKAIALAECELLLARIHRKIVGWVAFGRCRDAGAPPGRAEIWALYVAPSSWSQGVGRALCREARSSLAGQGYRSLSLWVLADNARAIRFYVAAGFLPDPSGIKQISMGGKSLKELRYVAAVEG